MNNKTYICTWVYCDLKGDESDYPQVGGLSSSEKFQLIYWRCAVVFFASSCRINPSLKHILFTNRAGIPDIGDFRTEDFLDSLGVEVVQIPLSYRTPEGYYGSWKNQFYIFDILKYLSNLNAAEDDNYIILDSDCIWIKSADDIIDNIERYGTLTYDLKYPQLHKINGINRFEMQQIATEISKEKLSYAQRYYGGESFIGTRRSIERIYNEFPQIWENMQERFINGKLKFNEEAHVLSYIYDKLRFEPGTANSYIKRIWTTLIGYKNITGEEKSLTIWHVPSEKKYGIKRLFKEVIDGNPHFWNLQLDKEFPEYIAKYLGIPKRSLIKFVQDMLAAGLEKMRKA